MTLTSGVIGVYFIQLLPDKLYMFNVKQNFPKVGYIIFCGVSVCFYIILSVFRPNFHA